MFKLNRHFPHLLSGKENYLILNLMNLYIPRHISFVCSQASKFHWQIQQTERYVQNFLVLSKCLWYKKWKSSVILSRDLILERFNLKQNRLWVRWYPRHSELLWLI